MAGLESKLKIFKVDNNGNKIILKVDSNEYYNDSPRYYKEVIGYAVRKKYDNLIFGPTSIDNLDITKYKNLSFWKYQKSLTSRIFDENGLNPVSTTTNYFYDNVAHLQRTQSKSLLSTGDSLRIKTSYPDDLQSFTCKDSLLSQHRIAEKIMEEEYVKDQSWRKISTQKKTFKDWGNSILQPEYIESSTFNNPLEIRARFYNIDNANGNPLEFSKEDDMHTSYIWGYQKTKQVIEGKNVTYNNLNSAVNLTNPNLEQLLSQTTGIGNLTLQSQRNQWKEFNNTLRNQPLLSDAFVTTYTYKPLVGITSVTDPAGITSYYEYDSFGRLAFVRDNDYNIVKKYDYHYAEEEPGK